MRSLVSRGKVVVVGFIFFLSRILLVWSMQNITLTSSRLNVGDTLVSRSEQFEFGIFQLKNGNYYLCIRYAAPIGQTVVWVANRDQPLTFDKSYLKFSDGNLQLFDQNSVNPLWSSNVTSPAATVAKLLDTGNVVLEDNNGIQTWNSFNNSITDTLLPDQCLQRRDPRQSTLTSWLSRDNPATGNYTFGWGTTSVSNGTYVTNVSTLQLACYQTCQTTLPTEGVYIPAPDVDNPHIISNVDYVYFHPTLGALYFPTSRPLNSTLPPAWTRHGQGMDMEILEIIGQSSPDWTPVVNWVVNERATECFAMGTCGPFGLCQMTPSGSLDRVQCTCPYGFELVDKIDFSRGCNQRMPLSDTDYCGARKLFNMTELDGIDMPWVGGYGEYTIKNGSANCTASCVDDCKCTGVVYSKDEQRCRKETGTFYNLGYPTVALHGNDRNAKIKVSIFQPQVQDHKDRKLWILAPALGAVFGMGLLVWCVCRFRRSLPQICEGGWAGRTTLKDHGVPDHFGGPPNAPPQPLVE